ncbi:S8 family peptidase [Hansschlegelia quercus]|uniref:S8 family peptidase n=1 Tax=Hansschlegelia quercus TaxID=2528245 RepID=UPI0013EF4013|nr:S8 family peptidase [Hansschlegelia quercus]
MKNRRAHSRSLARDLDQIIAAKGRLHDKELPEEEAGVHLTAFARTAAGIQASGALMDVLSIKGEGKDQRVNLFIRSDRIDEAKKRLDRYADFEANADEKVRKPWSFPFFEAAERLAPTKLTDLWTDRIELFPKKSSSQAEWEVWVRADAANRVRGFAGRYGVFCELGQADFPSVSMIRVRASADDLQSFVDASSAVLELRACSSLTLLALNMKASAQRALADGLVSKISAPRAVAPAVCILDTGVMASHPLLAPALDAGDCLTLNDAWDKHGWDPHGTRVAGLVLYRDLERLIEKPRQTRLDVRLESVVVLRPPTGLRSSLESIGEVVAAVGLIEAGRARPRVFCLAFSDYRGLNDGVPTKLSGSVDQLAWGHNGVQRLFCVAAGNLSDDPLLVSGYSARNDASGIGSPGQALNALTVGGCTFIEEHPLGGQLLCPAGDISVTSRTSTSWTLRRRSIKPDLVFEAGNVGQVDGEDACESLAELNPLTTNASPRMLLGTLGETSAATGSVSGMAGRLMARYPDYWPETIRGLLIHSSDWTPAMVERGFGDNEEKKREHILSMFGWGAPDESMASDSASNRLTLVAQSSLVPFKEDGRSNALNECAYHPLPWPETALRGLGDTEVELRVTLSYFVQPDMRAPSARRHADYPSHRLHFDLKGPDDDDLDAARRQNRAFRGIRSASPPRRSEARWRLGSTLRERGTVHHDVWTGPASELARQNALRIAPRGGWWRDAPVYAGVPVRYALIVSLRTPESAQDIYQETRTRVAAIGSRLSIPLLEPYVIQPVPIST